MFFKKFLLVSFILLAFVGQISAQKNQIDSVIVALKKIDVAKGVDTAKFTNLTKIIEETRLNDAAINALEKAAENLNLGDNIFWNYFLRNSIMNSLIATDRAKAISYGKRTYESLQTVKTLLTINIRDDFFRLLRVPYRTSGLLDDGFAYFNGKLKEFQLKNDSLGLAECYYVLGGFYRTKGLMAQAIYNMKKSVSYLSKNSNIKTDFFVNNGYGNVNLWVNNTTVLANYYFLEGNYEESLKYSRIAFKELSKNGNVFDMYAATQIAYAKLMSGKTDSIEYFLKPVFGEKGGDNVAFALQVKALYKFKIGKLTEAETLLQQCWQLIQQENLPANSTSGVLNPDYYLYLIREKQNRIPEAILLLQKDLIRVQGLRREKLIDYRLLSALYEREGNFQQANLNNNYFITLQDSLLQDQKKYGSLSFETEQQINANELSISKLQSENKIGAITRNFTIGLAVLLLLLAGTVYYRYKSKQKANAILEKTLSDLKSTQTQLIQSEKMASLGELTAGIAHEIQNPLNFVNNFSEVSNEMIQEIKEERAKNKDERDEALQDEILEDISKNLEKINHHGKRADAIVKGMLQHSRSSSGTKEPTDINALCDEYLRLAYHGLRAKDKSFNAAFETDLDASIGKINIVPQDMGRVIMNLVTNAFYAVDEKKKTGIENYEPTVSIVTKKINDKVEIRVNDNGDGIPASVKEKIFQPFFTTKPTGKGTGLGLSLSYDIVKAHGGELKVETKEREGSVFIIVLPVA